MPIMRASKVMAEVSLFVGYGSRGATYGICPPDRPATLALDTGGLFIVRPT